MTRRAAVTDLVTVVWLKRVLWCIVFVLAALRSAWLAFARKFRGLVRGSGWHGTSPNPPTILGVVLAQQLKAGGSNGPLSKVTMLTCWAHQQGVRQLFLYDPKGWLQRHRRELEKELGAAFGRASDSLAVDVGWPFGPDALQHQPPLSHMAPAAARQRRRQPAGECSLAQRRDRGPRLQVVLLCAADAIWPLAAASQAPPAVCKDPCSLAIGTSDRAAPAATVAAVRKVHWGVPAVEDDAEGVHAPPKAGLVPLAASSSAAASAAASEMFSLCRQPSADPNSVASRLAGQSEVGNSRHSREVGGLRGCGRHSMEPGPLRGGRLSAELGGFQSSLAKEVEGASSTTAAHREPVNEWPLQSSFRPRASLETPVSYIDSCSELEGTLAAPNELRARLGQAAGPLAATEPDLVLVFGGAPTLAQGYPPWAVQGSEIFHAGPLERLQQADLQRDLREYLASKQRFGT